ncbi:MAG: 1,4-dihydroxy-6-naphthoate synthase [Planctomycetota bacterium]
MIVSVGISTCPNDTFAFHALMTGKVRVPGMQFDFSLADVEELNRAVLAGAFDVAKTSFACALRVAERVTVLRSGSALGHGVGPVLLARPNYDRDAPRIVGPGPHTTATLLYQLFHGPTPEMEHRVFSDIMPALERAEADLGLCIHEGRFTYEAHGLKLIEDLGETWERDTGTPLPLGGIVANNRLAPADLATIDAAIRDSIEYAYEHRDEVRETQRRFAQELDDDVIDQHVTLYVNERTIDLGDVGYQALEALTERARKQELVPSTTTLAIRPR